MAVSRLLGLTIPVKLSACRYESSSSGEQETEAVPGLKRARAQLTGHPLSEIPPETELPTALVLWRSALELRDF
jgi:hypothetical protein